MAAKTTTKKVYYLRAFNNKKPKDLQALIEKTRVKKPTVGATEIKFGVGDIVRIQRYKASKGVGVFLQLSRYVPGEKAPTLQPKAKATEDQEGTQPAPAGMEFKDGDCFLLVSKHHVMYCGHGIYVPKASQYLKQLFKDSGVDSNQLEFELSPTTNLDKLKLLQEHGVKSILLSSNAFDISLPNKLRKSWISRSLGKISDELKALAEKDESVAEQKAREDLLVKLELRLDGNTRAAHDAQEFIEDIAETVLDDVEAPISEFAIVTQKGETIKPGTIRLQKGYKVSVQDRSVSHVEMWESLESYLNDIKQGNLLEQ